MRRGSLSALKNYSNSMQIISIYLIPLTMFYGLSLIALIYLGANLLYHTVLGIEGVRNSLIVASDTASILFGNSGATIISLVVIISATGSINGTMMSASRLYYAMARDKLLFNWFNYIHPWLDRFCSCSI